MRENEQAVRAIRALAERYVDAVYRADIAALRECFHPAAVMSRLPREGPPGRRTRTLLRGRGRHSVDGIPGAPYAAEVRSVEVVGRAAALRIDETGFFGALSFANCSISSG